MGVRFAFEHLKCRGRSPRRLVAWNVLQKERLRELTLFNLQKKSQSESECSLPLLRGNREKMEPDFSLRCTAKGKKAAVTCCRKGILDR